MNTFKNGIFSLALSVLFVVQDRAATVCIQDKRLIKSGDEIVAARLNGDLLVAVDERGYLRTARVTEASAAVWLGDVSANLGVRPNTLALSGNYAYVAGDYGGVAICDISILQRPVVVSRINPALAMDLVVRDGLLYVASASYGLQVVDVHTPDLPKVLHSGGGIHNDGVSASGICLSGHFAILSGAIIKNGLEGIGLVVIDIANPLAPKTVGRLTGLAAAYSVTARGSLVYVASGTDGIVAVDITNPNQPSVLWKNPLPPSSPRFSGPRRVILSDQLVMCETLEWYAANQLERVAIDVRKFGGIDIVDVVGDTIVSVYENTVSLSRFDMPLTTPKLMISRSAGGVLLRAGAPPGGGWIVEQGRNLATWSNVGVLFGDGCFSFSTTVFNDQSGVLYFRLRRFF